MTSPAIAWLRDDLRVADNPALRAAVDHGGPVVVLYLLDEESSEVRPLGGAARWWLHHSLAALADDLHGRGGRLVLRRGAAEDVIPALVTETGADAIFWNRRYGASREIDARLKERLRGDGVEVTSFAANLLVEPWTVTTDQGNPFQVFTPFWRAAQQQPIRDLVPAPRELHAPRQVDSDELGCFLLTGLLATVFSDAGAGRISTGWAGRIDVVDAQGVSLEPARVARMVVEDPDLVPELRTMLEELGVPLDRRLAVGEERTGFPLRSFHRASGARRRTFLAHRTGDIPCTPASPPSSLSSNSATLRSNAFMPARESRRTPRLSPIRWAPSGRTCSPCFRRRRWRTMPRRSPGVSSAFSIVPPRSEAPRSIARLTRYAACSPPRFPHSFFRHPWYLSQRCAVDCAVTLGFLTSGNIS